MEKMVVGDIHMEQELFERLLTKVTNTIVKTLKEKNKSYGGSAVNPLGIFTKIGVKERLLVRIEDKLKRIQTLGFEDHGEDNLADLIGYFIILRVWMEHEKES